MIKKKKVLIKFIQKVKWNKVFKNGSRKPFVFRYGLPKADHI